jgi:hypothetical protein
MYYLFKVRYVNTVDCTAAAASGLRGVKHVHYLFQVRNTSYW